MFDFLKRSRPKERQYLTRAIENDTNSLDISSAGKGYAPFVKCIADFKILKLLLETLPNEKFFPLSKTRGFNESFYKGQISKVISFVDIFDRWYSELSSKNRAFAPLKEIKPFNMSNIIRNGVELNAKDVSYYLLQMITNSKQYSDNKERNFLEYAYNAIDIYTKKILK